MCLYCPCRLWPIVRRYFINTVTTSRYARTHKSHVHSSSKQPFVDVTWLKLPEGRIFLHSSAVSWRITTFPASAKSTSSPNGKMLSTMRKVCLSSARLLRPVACSTSILTRNAHQAKAQAPPASPSSGDDYDLKLVNGKKKFFFYSL